MKRVARPLARGLTALGSGIAALSLAGCEPPGYILEVVAGSIPPHVLIDKESVPLAGQKQYWGKAPCIARVALIRNVDREIIWAINAGGGKRCVLLRDIIVGQTPPGFTVEQRLPVNAGEQYVLEISGDDHRRGSVDVQF